jgi:hypothetical protein
LHYKLQDRRVGLRARDEAVDVNRMRAFDLDGLEFVVVDLHVTALAQLVAFLCSLPRVMLHLGARLGLRSLAAMGLRRLELGAVFQHGEHDDGEPTRERYPRLAHR